MFRDILNKIIMIHLVNLYVCMNGYTGVIKAIAIARVYVCVCVCVPLCVCVSEVIAACV